MHLVKIDPTHPIFPAVVQLRYALFFEAHGLPLALARDAHEDTSTHLAIVDDQSALLAYGRLTGRSFNTAIISQMVVQPDRQRAGYGTQVVVALLAEARSQDYAAVELAARQPAVGFYERLGFRPISPPFPSRTTGLAHIQMRLDL